MKLLTIIPNTRDAILYSDTLFKAFEDSNIGYEGDIEIFYNDQESVINVSVPEEEFEEAFNIMQEVIREGPPK